MRFSYRRIMTFILVLAISLTIAQPDYSNQNVPGGTVSTKNVTASYLGNDKGIVCEPMCTQEMLQGSTGLVFHELIVRSTKSGKGQERVLSGAVLGYGVKRAGISDVGRMAVSKPQQDAKDLIVHYIHNKDGKKRI